MECLDYFYRWTVGFHRSNNPRISTLSHSIRRFAQLSSSFLHHASLLSLWYPVLPFSRLHPFSGQHQAVPPTVPRQPQYPSSDGGSSAPSTPASTRSASSNSSGQGKSKARIFDHDPKYPAGAEHWHSKHNGKCPECGRSSALTEPRWHSKKNRLFIKCTGATCKYFRFTDYLGDPPASPPSNSATAIPSGITSPCLAEPCSTGNNRNRNRACINKMCLQDCVKLGRADCPEHRRAKQAHLSGTAAGRPPSVLFNGPSLPSMPSIPPPTPQSSLHSSTPSSYTPSILDAALPPSSPNPPNPRSLLEITTSTVKPSRDNPLPIPIASPLEHGPTFQEVRRYARSIPHDWAEVIAAQQATKAQQMLNEARFRSDSKEGISITVVMWRADPEVAPLLFERVIHSRNLYALSEDVDLSAPFGFTSIRLWPITYYGNTALSHTPAVPHTSGYKLRFSSVLPLGFDVEHYRICR
ncbi:hypothetical protein FS837_005474 [Tulasnella sp. UAMH 9824]|nr:hypothetical protein FS837_005474 [Tulasnella sp. UAMH 9824]